MRCRPSAVDPQTRSFVSALLLGKGSQARNLAEHHDGEGNGMMKPEKDDLDKSAIVRGLPSNGEVILDSGQNSMANILLVDDEPRNLDVLEAILESPELRLVRARTVEETLLALLRQEFAAIVLDVQMPEMSGFELARIIKFRRRNQHTPVIFLTAHFQQNDDVLSGYDAGAVDYLTKPVDPQILKSKINTFVDLFRTNQALAAANESLERQIIERRYAELALARLAAIVESSSDAILSQNLDGFITSWNAGAERIFGYTYDEIVGTPVARLIPPERVTELNHLIRDIERGQLPGPIETLRRCKDGHLVEVSLMLSPVRSAGGSLVALSSIARDIGERKRLETEVLLAADREQCRIAQDLHDGLGQQLAGISCLSNTLQKELEKKSVKEAARMAAKISQLLNTAVVQTRALAHGLYPVVSEPNGLMDALRGLAAGIAEIFQLPCDFDCPQPIPMNNDDCATHLYRIAQEAVNNSIKHGRAKRIKIGLKAAPDQLILTVDDDGVGIPDNVPSRRGMGLKIMENRACLMGGTLAIERNPEGGTRISCVVNKMDQIKETSQ